MPRKPVKPPDTAIGVDMDAFGAWLRHTFDRSPGELTKPLWYNRVDDPPTEWQQRPVVERDDPVATARRIRHLFCHAGILLDQYSDDQVGHGLDVIVNGSIDGEIYALAHRDVPVELRLTGLRSIVTLFREVFSLRLKDPSRRDGQLGTVCFMFWDVANLANPDGDTVLDVLEDTLALDSEPCQRAALHGLGHEYWSARNREEVTAIVDRWLLRHPDVPDGLRAYANDARLGYVM